MAALFLGLIHASSAHAVDIPQKKKIYDKNNTREVIVQPPATRVANPPPAQGNPVTPGTVTPDRLVCSDYEDFKNYPSTMPMQRRRSGWSCPPGYQCYNELNSAGIPSDCMREPGAVYGNTPACSWELCQAY